MWHKQNPQAHCGKRVLLVLICSDLHRLFSGSPFLSSDARSVLEPRRHLICAKPSFCQRTFCHQNTDTNTIYVLLVKSGKTISMKKGVRIYPCNDLTKHVCIDLIFTLYQEQRKFEFPSKEWKYTRNSTSDLFILKKKGKSVFIPHWLLTAFYMLIF